MKRLFVKVLSLVVVLAMISVFMVSCNKPAVANTEAETYVSLKINPEVEFTVDGDGNVSSVNAINADAEILLSDMDLAGEPVEQAAEEFVQAATEAGYIDVEGTEEENEVEVTVVDEDGEQENEVKTLLADKVRSYFNNKGINGKVSQATLDMYAEQAGQLGVSVGKMKMILRAIDLNPEMTLEELAAMPVKDLVKLIKVKHKENLNYTARQEFKTAREALRTEYAAMFTLGDEIEALETELASFTGTDEEKAAKEATLADKQAQYDTMKAEYKTKLDALLADAKADIDAIRAERKAEKQQKNEANKAKYEDHMNKADKGTTQG